MDIPELVRNRELLIEATKVLHDDVAHGKYPGALNIGSGSRILPGYVNIDPYANGAIADDQVTLQTIPDRSSSLIYSSHALEHSGHRETRKALKRWSNVLVKSGILFISLPDIDLNMSMLSAITQEQRDWYRCTIFGYQALQNNPEIDCRGEYHLCGYSLQEFGEMLKDSGFDIQSPTTTRGMGPGVCFSDV